MVGSQRRRLVVTVAAVATLAFAVGWMLGRGESNGRRGNANPPDASATTSVPPGLVGSRVPAVESGLTGDAGSQVEDWRFGSADVDPRAAALGVRIVGARPRRLLELDTATGRLAELDDTQDFSEPPQIDAGVDWILVRRTDISFAQLFRAREDPVTIVTGDVENMFLEPGTDRFWRVHAVAERGDNARVVELDHEGVETGVHFDVDGPGSVIGADPAGGVVVEAAGGSYHAGTDGSHRLTTGDIVAINADKALITECSDDLTTCGLVVLDRATGGTTPLEPVLPIGDPDAQIYASGASYGFPSLLSAISPDGRYAPVVINGTRLRFGVIDLETGDFATLGITPQSGLWWAPDSRSVLYLFNDRLFLHDFDTRLAFEVVHGVRMEAFAVRP